MHDILHYSTLQTDDLQDRCIGANVLSLIIGRDKDPALRRGFVDGWWSGESTLDHYEYHVSSH